MKLYSRGQVVFFSALSALAVAVVALGVGLSGVMGAGGRAASGDAGVSGPQAAAHDVIREISRVPVPLQIDVAELAAFTESERTNIAIYERLNAGVVNITTETVAINWFLEPVPRAGSSGSGSIISDRGYVLTNYHVVRNAHNIFITLADGNQYAGTLVGADPENDLAVLRFDPPQCTELRVIPFGSSENLRVGQKVLAIGNPFALERTLTVGIVSGLGRPIQTSSRHIIRNMIQTDASINPGNSGGPLLNAQGQMIGINTMIYSPTGGSVGIGFAVPVDTARRVVAEIIAHGSVRRGWIDATVVQIFPALVRHANLPVTSGFLVSRTRRNGLAERAGLRQGTNPVQHGRSIIYLGGDIITSVNGIPTNSLADFYSALEDNRPGDVVRVGIIRDGRELALNVPLADRQEALSR
ncbi:MAG: trypsin-like peptidase domain-containing protein [Treponema sp.]|nr:trypsin-like peptidase domain-containing protein [Treponema sp.]